MSLLEDSKRFVPRIESLGDIVRLLLIVISPILFWIYSNKFLGMSADYLTSMSRDIVIDGNQMNLAYYPIERLMILFGGFILVCFLLVQNEFKSFLRIIMPKTFSVVGDTKKYSLSDISTSLFAIFSFLIAYPLVTSVLDLSPGTQIPFFFLGGALVAGILLLQDNIDELLQIRSHNYREYTEFNSKSIGAVVSILSIVMFATITFNMPMFPIISQNIPAFLSALTMLAFVVWMVILSQEGAKPSVQSKRTASLAFLVLFPLASYLLLRLVFLQNDGTDPTMLNRWEIRFDFMEKVNTFKINPWPMEAEPNIDSRWLFLKAAIINSARVTLVSIVLCTILGIIVGVTRLSTNKLAAAAATVYVEVFRNLPLAVLLFLISSQMGAQLPWFIDDYHLLEISQDRTGSMAGLYISNEGTWFVDFASYFHVLIAVSILALIRVILRHIDRVPPSSSSKSEARTSIIRRPFSLLGSRLEPIAADLFLLFSFLLALTTIVPFLSTEAGSDVQTLSQIRDTAIYPLLSIFVVIYAFYIATNVDDDGFNNLEIDDSEEGIRKRFTIWVAAIAVAFGIAVSGGISWPEYTKDWNFDGVIDSPGAWRIIDGTGFEMTPAFIAMLLGLTLFTASVVAEIVRGSIQSLPRGQVEAAISLSLNPYQRLRLVILPQALRSMVPLLNNQYMNVWKNSSLAVVVAYTDIFYVILVMMNNVGKLIPLFLLLLITYQAGSLTISAIMNWYNSRVTKVKI